VDEFSKYLLNTEVGVEAALTKAMSLRVVGTHRYDSEPAAGRKNYDLGIVSALAYKF
jgi:putative salt-induced outer membrane protein YdiY